MKRVAFLLLGFIVSTFYWSCESEPNSVQELDFNHQDPVTSVEDDAYEWKMVIKSVDSFVGGPTNATFIDILLGNPIPSDIFTTNITYFNMDPESNEVELELLHGGWTIWEANGFYPITWKFEYKKTSTTLELKGYANIGLSNCELPEGSTLVNRFYFNGKAKEITSDKYIGRYVWSETYETGTCIWVEGDMKVLRKDYGSFSDR